jgi:hypothetical protein
MASDGSPGNIPAASPVHGSPTAISTTKYPNGGNPVPLSGKKTSEAAVSAAAHPSVSSVDKTGGPAAAVDTAAEPQAKTPAKTSAPAQTNAQVLADQLNKHLNDSGRPDEFRVDPASGNKLIQQINPATGAVVGEFAVNEFPALARSIGASGLLVDSLA